MAIDVAQDRLSGTWNFNRVHSSATFSVRYIVVAFRGRFEEFDVQFSDGKLSGAVKANSVVVTNELLAGSLKSPEFFDCDQHPELSFATTALSIDGDRLDVDGELTIKGITRPVRATGKVAGPIEDNFGGTRLGFALETTIDRTEFGLEWNSPLPKGGFVLSNEVTLSVELEFLKAA